MINILQFPARGIPGQTLWQFLGIGWKFPFMATMIVGVSIADLPRNPGAAGKQESGTAANDRTGSRGARIARAGIAAGAGDPAVLLPKEIPQLAGFEIDGAWEPAHVVGGDYFDVIRLSETKFGICIADVVGKSVSAALLMANVQASVRAFALSRDILHPSFARGSTRSCAPASRRGNSSRSFMECSTPSAGSSNTPMPATCFRS